MRMTRISPITKVSPAQAIELARQLKSDILGYTGSSEDTMYDDGPYRNIEICNDIEGHARDDGIAYDYYSYQLHGRSVGLLVINAFPALGTSHLWIECLVTHPGTKEGGTSLLEHAVKLSSSVGLNGLLRLGAAYDEAERFYAAMGFERTGLMLEEDTGDDVPYRYPEMELNPNKNLAKWRKNGKGRRGEWIMKRFDSTPLYLA